MSLESMASRSVTRARILTLAIVAPFVSLSASAQMVTDSVEVDKKIFYWQSASGDFYNCGAGVYVTWPNVAERVLNRETGYNSYSLVATDGMYVPGGYGEATNSPSLGITVPEGHLGHNPQLGGASSSPIGYTHCGNHLAGARSWLGGATRPLNGRPFRVTDWYAVYEVPAGTVVGDFVWDQKENLDVAFDGAFPRSREVEADGKVPVVTYEWNFGDGETGTGPTPVHSYAEAGTYEVTLTVTDDDDETDEVSYSIEVSSVVLLFSVDADEKAAPGDTLGLVGMIKNIGTGTAHNVSASRSILRLPSFPDSTIAALFSKNDAEGSPTRSVADTTYETIEPGETVFLYQFFKIEKSAEANVNGKWKAVTVDWELTLADVKGEDEDGNPAKVRDKCESESCHNVARIENKAMSVEFVATRLKASTTSVGAGLSKWTSDIYPKGVYYHLVPPFSFEPECNSGCVDLEVTITGPEGEPVEGAVIKLTRKLTDPDPMNKSIVTPDQGGGVFCYESTCKDELELPPTNAEGKQTARFWVPGVKADITAAIKATATKEGYTETESESELTIKPTRVEAGKQTATPSSGDMTAVSMTAALQFLATLPDLNGWCKKATSWAVETDAKLASIKIPWGFKTAVNKSIEWTCSESLKKYIYDEEFALDDEIKSRADKLKLIDLFGKATGVIGLYWFQGQFDLSLTGTGETTLTTSFPFLSHSSEFMDTILDANRAIAKQYVLNGNGFTPTLKLDLFEESHRTKDGTQVNALYFDLTSTPDLSPKVDVKKLITKNYNKSIFLTQENVETVTSTPSNPSDSEINVSASGKNTQAASGKTMADDSTFAVGHVLVLDPGLETQESVQIVSINGSALELSTPLKFAHSAGARVAYSDSLEVGPPDAPIIWDGLSGAAGASLTPELKWATVAPATSYELEVATDTLFSNVVQSFGELADPNIVLDELQDRTRYFWRVAANNTFGRGEWSSWYSFFTGRPIGDDLSEARPLSTDLGTSRVFLNNGATSEAAEVEPSCGSAANSMWFSYTPSTSGRVAVETFDSPLNTAISVWTGTQHPLTEVACSDDYDNGDHPTIEQSYAEFDAVAGTTYYIRAAGSAGAEGLTFLTVAAPTMVATESAPEASPDMLLEVYPNPASTPATIVVETPASDRLRLDLYDTLGRHVRILADGTFASGRHEFGLTTADLPSGLYLVTVRSSKGLRSRPLTILR